MNNRTFAIIKPDSYRNGNADKIYNHIKNSGFKILAEKKLRMSLEQAHGFYAVHQDKPFFNELTEFMSSGICMVLALELDNAVETWRETIGATDPRKAEVGTIRALYGTNVGENAVHGSDSDINAQKEISFFFSNEELEQNK